MNIMIGMMVNTINASRQLMISMKIVDDDNVHHRPGAVHEPQVSRSETRPVSDVTRAIKRPTAFWA